MEDFYNAYDNKIREDFYRGMKMVYGTRMEGKVK